MGKSGYLSQTGIWKEIEWISGCWIGQPPWSSIAWIHDWMVKNREITAGKRPDLATRKSMATFLESSIILEEWTKFRWEDICMYANWRKECRLFSRMWVVNFLRCAELREHFCPKEDLLVGKIWQNLGGRKRFKGKKNLYSRKRVSYTHNANED